MLGAGGKMGPTVARMARAAFQAAGRDGQVMAVSRFSDPAARAGLEAAGVRTLTGDLLDPDFLRELPDAPDVVFMAGRKFGSTGAEHLTWAMNAHLPGLVARRLSRCALRGLLHRRRLPVHVGRLGRGRTKTWSPSRLGSTRSRAWQGSGCSSTRPTPGVCARR